MFSQLMETAEPWFSTFEHDGQKVTHIIDLFSILELTNSGNNSMY
jgi:hypothetical protein